MSSAETDAGTDSEPRLTSRKALSDFMEGVAKRVGPDYGRVSNRQKEDAVKEQIACELGLEDEYVGDYFAALGAPSEDEVKERMDVIGEVEDRYDELVRQGRIEVDPEYKDQKREFRREILELERELRGKLETSSGQRSRPQ